MLCFNEIKLRGDGARRWQWPGLKGTKHIFLPCQAAPPGSCCQGPRPEAKGSGGHSRAPPAPPAEATKGARSQLRLSCRVCVWRGGTQSLSGAWWGCTGGHAASDRYFVGGPRPLTQTLCSPPPAASRSTLPQSPPSLEGNRSEGDHQGPGQPLRASAHSAPKPG